MSQFYSLLCTRAKPGIGVKLTPLYNKEYFKRLTKNIDQLNSLIETRCKYVVSDPNSPLRRDNLELVKKHSPELVKLREQFEKHLAFNTIEGEQCQALLNRIETIENLILPTILSLPNRLHKLVPKEDVVIEEVKSGFLARQRLPKTLSYRKLSFINNCYSKSVVGPNSHYYIEIGAKLQNALSSFFAHELESYSFIPLSGLCMTKSPIVEASNSSDEKLYHQDPARVLTSDKSSLSTNHVTEANRESLIAFMLVLGHLRSNEPTRFFLTGAGYRNGSDWFDGGDKRITQFETIHALVLNSSIESYSVKEYRDLVGKIWKIYKELELPIRLVHCCAESMQLSEFDSHRIDVWLPSRRDWLQVARISHYHDYLSIRSGLRRGHLIDSMVYDGQALFAAIIENRQTNDGKFIIPDKLRSHLLPLSDKEHSYINRKTDAQSSNYAINEPMRVQLLHEQRRYLKRKSYHLGHSQRAKERYNKRGFSWRMGVLMIGSMLSLLDWHDIWMFYVPEIIQGFLYDYFYRPVKRIYWQLTYVDKSRIPRDVSWDEIDKTEYRKTVWDHRRDKYLENHRALKDSFGELGKIAKTDK